MGFKSPPSHQSYFYPRPPRGGRPLSTGCALVGKLFLSTPSARRATKMSNTGLTIEQISIHALREEGDSCRTDCSGSTGRFLSTPSARRATSTRVGCVTFWFLFLSTPSARRATAEPRGVPRRKGISIHALREEGDPFSAVRFWLQKVFLSTPSARRATLAACAALHADAISIHALREEGDTVPSSETTSVEDFYPRPPRGGRLQPVFQGENCCLNFYPRPPRGGRRSLQQQRPA